MTHLWQDLRYVLRGLRKRPAFTTLVIAALALCLGANSAIFTIVNTVLLRPLPFREPGRLVSVFEVLNHILVGPLPFSAPDYEEFLKRNHSFSSMGIYTNHSFELSGVDQPEHLQAARVSASLFPTLAVAPALSRNFTEQEDRNAARVVILSASLWHSRFAGNRAILGKRILLDRIPYTVVGVMPDNVTFPFRGPAFNNEPAALFVPISFTAKELNGWGTMFNDSVIARLRPGVTIPQARAEVNRLADHVYRD